MSICPLVLCIFEVFVGLVFATCRWGSLFNCFRLFSFIKLSTFFSTVFSSIITIALLLSAFTIFEGSFSLLLYYIGIFCVIRCVYWSLECVSFAWMLNNGRCFVFWVLNILWHFPCRLLVY